MVTQIEPRLDVFWQEQLLDIFKSISAQDRQNVAEQLLKPKNIFWNSQSKQFEYRGEHQPFREWIHQIPNEAKYLKTLALKLNESLNTLTGYDELNQTGDYLDNLFEQIDQVDVKRNLNHQILKQKLRSEFIYAVAALIRNHPHWNVCKTHRGINVPVLKTFICEVFLKQKLLGYWFKTLRNRQLADMPHPLIHDFLRQEQKVRQLEIVRASKYLFAIAPTVEYSGNPFIINRFMLEERLFSGEHLLVYGAAVNTALLAQYDERYQTHFKKQIDCIVTIESSISRVIIDRVDALVAFHDEQLVPLLFARFDTARDNLNTAVNKRLAQYEQLLCQNILKPLHALLTHHAKNEDEFNYLYVAARQLVGSMIAVFRDFQTQPALAFNQQADILFGKLVAYITFLEKRRDQIFVVQSAEEWRQAHQASALPLKEIQAKTQEKLAAYRDLQEKIHLQTELLAKPAGFWDKLFKTKDTQAAKLEHLKNQRRSLSNEVYRTLQDLLKQHDANLVYLEFDSQLISDDKMRHYALAHGDNGITDLPAILKLPESRATFDYEQFAEQLAALDEA